MLAMQKIEQFVGDVAGAETVPAPPYADANWFVLMTEPNREMTAQANLILRKVPFYLPTIYRLARVSVRQLAKGVERPDVLVPLFPRMLFVPEPELNRNYALICATPGMLPRPLMWFGDHMDWLRPLAMAVVRRIEAGERQAHLHKKRQGQPPAWLPSVGDEVQVLVDEVLGGARGIVESVDERGRIVLLTEIMKRTGRLKLTAGQIEPVQTGAAGAMVRR
jgi:transcription antitermination factor NusG